MTGENPRRRQSRDTTRTADSNAGPEMGQLEEVAPVAPAKPSPAATAPSAARGPEPEPQPIAPQAPEPTPPAATSHPRTMREMLARVDEGWRWFRAAAGAFPSERMDEHLSEHGWTRKQMVAHVAAWHDLTADRLGRMLTTGKAADLADDTDAFNARVARQAVGRTAGELLKDMEMTFNRLRRRLAQLNDEHLAVHDGWAAHVIAGNTYEHYDEHRDDVVFTPAGDPRGGRR